MTTQAKRFRPVALLGWILFGYAFYFLLLGPFWAIDGRGFLDSVPGSIRTAVYLPAGPIMLTPARGVFVWYMDFWYTDPNAPDMPTGWDGFYWGPPP